MFLFRDAGTLDLGQEIMHRIIRDIPVSAIAMDRHPLNPSTLSLVEYLAAGGSVPPIHVAKTRSGYQICDGRHRVTASKLLGREMISARFARQERTT